MIGYKYVCFNADSYLRELWKLLFFPLLDIYWPQICRSKSERAMKTVLFPTERAMKTVFFPLLDTGTYWPQKCRSGLREL